MKDKSKPHPRPELKCATDYPVPGTSMLVLTDNEDDEYPIAIHGADWWLTKTEVASLITTLTKALQEAP